MRSDRLLQHPVVRRKAGNIYDRPLVRRLVADGIEGRNGAWRRWPRPCTGKPTLTIIDGGRP